MNPMLLMVIGLAMTVGTAALERRARHGGDAPADADASRHVPEQVNDVEPFVLRGRLLAAHRTATIVNGLLGLTMVTTAVAWFMDGGEVVAFVVLMIGGWLGLDAIGRVWALNGIQMKAWRSAPATIWTATVDDDDEDYEGFIGSLQLTLTRDGDGATAGDGARERELRGCLVRFFPRTAQSASAWNGRTVILLESAHGQVIGSVPGRRLYHASSFGGWPRSRIWDPDARANGTAPVVDRKEEGW